MKYAACIPWQFVLPRAVDWAREAIDVRAVFNHAKHHKAPSQSYQSGPEVQNGLALAPSPQLPVFTRLIYSADVVMLAFIGGNASVKLTITKTINNLKNVSRSPVGKDLLAAPY